MYCSRMILAVACNEGSQTVRSHGGAGAHLQKVALKQAPVEWRRAFAAAIELNDVFTADKETSAA